MITAQILEALNTCNNCDALNAYKGYCADCWEAMPEGGTVIHYDKNGVQV